MRAHASADVLGKILTPYWDDLAENDETKYVLAADEWVVTNRINANTNRNFTNWQEFLGPNQYNGDNFTNIVGFLHSRLLPLDTLDSHLINITRHDTIYLILSSTHLVLV